MEIEKIRNLGAAYDTGYTTFRGRRATEEDLRVEINRLLGEILNSNSAVDITKNQTIIMMLQNELAKLELKDD